MPGKRWPGVYRKERQMNKSELVVAIADRSGVTQQQARGCLDAFLEIVCEEVSAGREVNVTGYMKFSQVKRKARMGRNPRTGELVPVPATTAVKFQPGTRLKAAGRG